MGRKIGYVLLGVGILLVLFGCYRRPTVRGPEYRLFVFAEKEDWEKVEPVLREVFERPILTPQTEYHFYLVYADPEKFSSYLTRKQLLFVSTLESQGAIADLVRRSVSRGDLLEQIQRGEKFLFKRENQWIPKQIILMLVGPSMDTLIAKIRENADFIYNLLYEYQQNMVHQYMYRELENKKLSEELLKKYKWTVRVQHDYFLAREDSANGFVFLRRRYPERWFFVKWIENADPNVISETWYMDLRDSIGVQYYGGDKVNRKFTHGEIVNFLGRRCLRMEGLWENDEKVAGGPLLAYVFYDEGTQRIYVIDCSVFAPGDYKMPYLDQLDVMAKTFQTIVDVQREEYSEQRTEE